MQVETILKPKWVVPVYPDNIVLENTAIIINDGRITDILPTGEAEQKYQSGNIISLPDHVIMPGLINAHTHAAMNLLRGIADDLPLMQWLEEHIWPAEHKWVSPDFVYEGVQLACAEMLRGGITCFADMYFFPESTARAVEHCGIRAAIGMIVIDFPSAYAQNAREYLHKGIQLHDQLRSNSLISTMLAPHAPYTVGDEAMQNLATMAEELDIPIHMHIHETLDEINHSMENYQQRPLERLEKLGLLSPRLIGVHMTQLQDDEIATYANYGAHVVHCPESNLKLASGFCRVNDLQNAGINIALGTDGTSSNNDLDMFGEMRTAALLGKGISNDATATPATAVLEMATINAARSLGLEEETGSIEKGKAADLIAVDFSNIESQPCYEVISQIVYATQRSQVSDVWVAGRHLLKNRELTTLDHQQLMHNAGKWQERIQN